jgi:hypothetical protein
MQTAFATALPRFTLPSEAAANDITSTHTEMARDAVLGDIDDVADHLGAACMGRSKVDSDRATRMPGRLEVADDATVLHAALVAGLRGDNETAGEAMRILAQRHLDRNARRVSYLAAEYAA